MPGSNRYTGRGPNPDLTGIRIFAILIIFGSPAFALWYFISTVQPTTPLASDQPKTVKISRD